MKNLFVTFFLFLSLKTTLGILNTFVFGFRTFKGLFVYTVFTQGNIEFKPKLHHWEMESIHIVLISRYTNYENIIAPNSKPVGRQQRLGLSQRQDTPKKYTLNKQANNE